MYTCGRGWRFPGRTIRRTSLYHGFARVATVGGATLQLQWVGFPLQWLLVLQSTGPRAQGASVFLVLGLSCPKNGSL